MTPLIPSHIYDLAVISALSVSLVAFAIGALVERWRKRSE